MRLALANALSHPLSAGQRLFGLPLAAALVLGLLGGCDEVDPAERLQRAEAFLERGRANGAVLELKELLQGEPRHAEARLLLARAYLALDQLDSAEKELLRARELGGDAAVVDLALARVWSRQGANTKVVERFRVDDAWPPETRAEALVIRANAHFALGELEPAAAGFEAALRLRADGVDGLVGLARIALKSGDRQRLSQVLARALTSAPDHPYFQGLRSGRAFADGRYDEAVSGFQKQLRAGPGNVVARLGLVQAMMASGRSDEARQELGRVLEASPRHPSAHYLSAVLALQAGDHEGARRHSLLALSLRPEHGPSTLIAGIASYALGRWRDSRWHLETLARRGAYRELAAPMLEEIERRLARPQVGTTEEAALAGLERDLALYRLTWPELTRAPDNADAAAEVGPLLAQAADALRQGGTGEAVLLLQRAYAAAPERRVLLALAFAHRRDGAPAAGRNLLELWLTDRGGDRESRHILADLYIFDGEPERAMAHLRRLVADDGDDVIALNNLAWVLLQRGDAAEALALAERAAALAPGDPRVLDTLGMAHLQLGNAGQAIPVLRRAAHSSIAGPVAKLHLAEALYRDGETAEAKALLREVLDLERARPLHRAARNLLRKIEG